MTVLSLPWVELAVLIPLLGAAAVRLQSRTEIAHIIASVCTAGAFAASVFAWLSFAAQVAPVRHILPWPNLHIDAISAPLLTIVALLHLLTIITTARVKRNRMSFSGHLVGESIRLATFACLDPWPLILLLALGLVPPLLEMRQRSKPTRVFLLHMFIFVALLLSGWLAVEQQWSFGYILLMGAVLVRSGAVPGHLWVADLFNNATFGTALLFATPIAGMYTAVRLVLPGSPEWVLSSIVIVSLITALWTAAVALIQTESRRFFAYFFLSQSSLVLIGLEVHSPVSLIGSLALWLSTAVSLGGLGLVFRSLESRFGHLTFAEYRGLYSVSPTLALGFAIFGLSSVGFPGTMGFIAAEMVLDGAIVQNFFVGFVMVLATAFNGIAILRVYFLLFAGAKRPASPTLVATPFEIVAIVVLITILIGCGLMPQWWLLGMDTIPV